MRLYGFLAFIFIGRFLYPRGRHKPHRLITTRLFWACGQFLRASYEAGQDKHGVQRRQTRARVPKRQFSASKKKKEGESAFSDFIGFYFIYRAVGIYGFYPGIGRIIHPRLCSGFTNALALQLAALAHDISTESSLTATSTCYLPAPPPPARRSISQKACAQRSSSAPPRPHRRPGAPPPLGAPRTAHTPPANKHKGEPPLGRLCACVWGLGRWASVDTGIGAKNSDSNKLLIQGWDYNFPKNRLRGQPH
jgi:hypothetical protein